jgi:tetratricopeptide (TPR) repeat protein
MKKIAFALIFLLFTMLQVQIVDSSSATTLTFARDKNGMFVATQDAYLPQRTVLDIGLDDPEDMFLYGNQMFIADTGDSEIVVYNIDTGEVDYTIENSAFRTPRGVYITDDELLYVADSAAEAVFKMTLDGTLLKTYLKPEDAAFSTTNYNPKKVAVDKQGNLYIVSEGVFSGIIQMNDGGSFDGFFTRNEVVLTPIQVIENFLFTDEQKDQLADRNPFSFSNIYVDEKGIKYTTSFGTGVSNLKKHNTDGSSSVASWEGVDLELLDVTTNDQGIIFTAAQNGMMYIFSANGSFIFGFGAQADNEDVAGLFSSLTAIEVDDDGRIWALDKDKAYLQSFTPTSYSTTIYEGLTLYNEGQYDEAVIIWEDVLTLNQLSVLAHNEIGRNLYIQTEYEEALIHFELAGNRDLYSEALWEIRNENMQTNLPFFLLGAFSFGILYVVHRILNKRYAYTTTIKGGLTRVNNVSFIHNITYMFNLLKHPVDSFYYIKKKQHGSLIGAFIIMFIFFGVYILFITSKGFIYQLVEPQFLNLPSITLGYFGIFLLFVVSNYLVTSIQDGEGSLLDIFKGVTYSLAPIILFYMAALYLSHILTYNETFIFNFTVSIGTTWTFILVWISVQEIQNYTFTQTFKSFLLTALFMLIMIVIFAFIQIMGEQLIQFLIGIVKELIHHVS